MGKANGGTRSVGPNAKQPAQTFEQQVDVALKGLKSDFFDKMEKFYDGEFERWQKRYDDWKEKDDYINGGASSISMSEYFKRETEAYGKKMSIYDNHNSRGRKLRDEYSDLVSGGYAKEGAKAPNFYDIRRGDAKISDATKAVKATAERTAEKKFSDVRSKMLKTTIDKGIDLKSASVRNADDEGFLISDGKVTLHARYILAWGEIKAPHFRFIITDRKS